MNHRLAARIALVAAAFTLGCSPATSPLDVIGTYMLKSVSGSPLPYQLPGVGPTRVHVLDDMIILTPSGTYSEVGHKLFSTGSTVTVAAMSSRWRASSSVSGAEPSTVTRSRSSSRD